MAEYEGAFCEHFADPELPRWDVVEKQWGGDGVNGGTVKENVVVANGTLTLICNGDRYHGPTLGTNRDGTKRTDGLRVGAAISTKRKFGYGTYEARLKLPTVKGVCSAMWTFHYDEAVAPEREGGVRIVNHEIDMEFPGRPGSEASDIGYEWALLNTYTGVEENEHSCIYKNLESNLSDGDFHTIKFEWHANDNGEPTVSFYADGELLSKTDRNVPYYASNLWIGCWFPKNWAGTPDFATDQMQVDWVKITPF